MNKLIFLLSLILMSCTTTSSSQRTISSQSQKILPAEAVRREMILNFVKEINRLDGEGLIPRKNRPETWEQTTKKLAEEAATAQDLFDLGRVFRKLDATYPNLHAKVALLPELDINETQGIVSFPFEFAPEVVKKNQKKFKYRITKSKVDGIQSGDQLLAINSIPLDKWSQQNFIYCKYPLREQCELTLFENFKNEILAWDRKRPIKLLLKRGHQEFISEVSIEIVKKTNPYDKFDFMNPPCGVKPERYLGWQIVFQGYNLCAFEHPSKKDTVLIRIRDFMYDEYRGRPKPSINISEEVDKFWNAYWKVKAPQTKTLIVDVIDNPGGDLLIDYYGIFFKNPFQEQYTQFKKIKEFERKDILQSIYWGEKPKDIWLENIKREGIFAATKEGDFLPHIPQFCADQKKDCREGLFPTRNNGFQGKVKLLFNHDCVSSCVGFIFNIIDVLKDRVTTYGMPDSADSAYARLTLGMNISDKEQIETSVLGLKTFNEKKSDSPWVREAVCVSRSTDRNGKILSGKSMRVDYWVPRSWNQTPDQWAAEVLNKASGT